MSSELPSPGYWVYVEEEPSGNSGKGSKGSKSSKGSMSCGSYKSGKSGCEEPEPEPEPEPWGPSEWPSWGAWWPEAEWPTWPEPELSGKSGKGSKSRRKN